MSKVVRSSKYRHIFGQEYKKDKCYEELLTTRNAWDSNFVTANPLYFALIVEASGGGAFAVVPWSQTGKLNNIPRVTGHKGAVLDLDWNPFNDNLVASASEDCYVKVWGIPEGGLKQNLTDPLQTLSGHKRKVGTCLFNPVANNTLMTTSTDLTVKIWDIEKGSTSFSLDGQHADIICSADWNSNGSLVATSSKDKKLRVIDPRANKVVQEVEAHAGIKGSRCCWLGNKERLLSCGFSKNSEREICIWDPKDLSKPLSRQAVDSAAGQLMPFYDSDTCVLFVGGKGDGNIRYYEIVDEAPYIHYLSEYKSNTPTRGLCLVPKRVMNVSECEIVRFLKVHPNKVEPISFQVPRKSDIFQDDIFPDCYAGVPVMSHDAWVKGENGNPKTQSMAPGFVPGKKVMEFNPEKVEEKKEMSEKELKDEVEKLTKRVAYLEAELVKRDSKIKELSS